MLAASETRSGFQIRSWVEKNIVNYFNRIIIMVQLFETRKDM